MALEITGKVQKVLETQKGEGRNGPWQKGGFILEYGDNFPKPVHCVVWGDLINQVEALREGDQVKASLDIQSREFNGRWYTDVKVWRLEKLTAQPIDSAAGNTQGATPPPPPPPSETEDDSNQENTEDDLPF